VILEAMYCGVPTVAYDTGGIAQLLTPATGWLIPAGNEQAFADSVVTLLTNNMNGVQERLQNAKQLVETSYTMEEVARQFEILYRRLAF
jgi:glycosyltransferase involved in cell wall biosynthesis